LGIGPHSSLSVFTRQRTRRASVASGVDESRSILQTFVIGVPVPSICGHAAVGDVEHSLTNVDVHHSRLQ